MVELILIFTIMVVSVIIGIKYLDYQVRARKGDVEKDKDASQQDQYIALAEKYLEQDAAYRIAAGIREKMPCQQHVYARKNIERLRQMPPGPAKDDFVHHMIRNGEIEELRAESRNLNQEFRDHGRLD